MTDPIIKLEETVKWRGSTYELVKVEDDRVYWFNPVSRHYDNCPRLAWVQSDPYDSLNR